MSAEEREILAKDPLAFRDFLAAVPAPNEPVQRAAVRYLAFSKFFRQVVNAGHRRLIRDAFAAYFTCSVPDDVDVDLDEINPGVSRSWGFPVLRKTATAVMPYCYVKLSSAMMSSVALVTWTRSSCGCAALARS